MNHPISHQTRVVLPNAPKPNFGLSFVREKTTYMHSLTLQEGSRNHVYRINLNTDDIYIARQRRDKLIESIKKQAEVMRHRHQYRTQ